MQKVIVIGCPGSGKSTFSRALHEATKLPLIHLDMLFWNADRTTVTHEVFDQRLEKVMDGECWIIDGNYSRTMELRMAACDTVFFLDYPTEVCLESIRNRRGKPRPDMPWIEQVDDPDYEEFLAFISNFNYDRRPQVMSLLDKYSEKNIYRFTSRGQADAFLKTIQEEAQWNLR